MAEKFDTFLVKKDGKWLHVKEKWVDGQEVARKALQDKGFETGTAMRDAKDRWVNVPDSQVEKAMEMGLHIPSAGSPTQKTQEDFKAEREAKQAAEPQSPYLTAAMEGTDSLMFNQLPNVSGALVGAKEALTGGSFQEGFDGQRQAVIDAMAKGRKDNPIVANATAMAADFANPINPLGKFKGAAKAINGLAKYGKILPTLVKQGGEAAFRSLGHAGDGEEVLTDAALGGGLGALGEGLTSQWVKDQLQDRKIKSALKHFGNQKSIVTKLGEGNLDEAAEFALEKNLIDPFENATDTLDRVIGKKGKATEALAEVRQKLKDSDHEVNPLMAAAEILQDNKFDPMRLEGPSFKGRKKFAKNMMASLFPERVNNGMGFDDLMLAREKASDLSNWKKGRAMGLNAKDDMARTAYHTLNDVIEREGNSLGGGLGSKFRETNTDFRLLSDLEKLAEHKVNRDNGNHGIGLRASILGAGLGAGGGFLGEFDPTGGLLSSGLGVLGAQGVMKYGPGVTAKAIHKAQKRYGKGYGEATRSIFDIAGNRAMQGQDEKDKEAAVNRHLSQ